MGNKPQLPDKTYKLFIRRLDEILPFKEFTLLNSRNEFSIKLRDPEYVIFISLENNQSTISLILNESSIKYCDIIKFTSTNEMIKKLCKKVEYAYNIYCNDTIFSP
jgi:hypothetical protein